MLHILYILCFWKQARILLADLADIYIILVLSAILVNTYTYMTDTTPAPKYNRLTEFPDHYRRSEDPYITTIAKQSGMTVTGTWHPDYTESVIAATKALSGIAFAIKFKMKSKKKESFFAYEMPPTESQRRDLNLPKEERSRKTILIQPNFVTKEDVLKMRRIAHAKSKDTKLPPIAFETFPKKKVVQIGHLGPYAEMDESISKLEKYAAEQWLQIVWPHHEIYLNDMRRTKAHELQTIIRYEVK